MQIILNDSYGLMVASSFEFNYWVIEGGGGLLRNAPRPLDWLL